jgi:hypothetical protein
MTETESKKWPSESTENYIKIATSILRSVKEKLDAIPHRDIDVIINELSAALRLGPRNLSEDEYERYRAIQNNILILLCDIQRLKNELVSY